MQRRFLGSTGLEVGELALGTMTFGDRTDEPTAHRVLDEFTAAGGTFIDTADTYQFGGSERIIGSWLRSHDRDDLVIATKAYGEMAAGAPVERLTEVSSRPLPYPYALQRLPRFVRRSR